MRNLLYIIAMVAILPIATHAQARIVILGSSTAYGHGATPIDSSWVNLTKSYYKSLDELDTIINLAVSGSTTFNGLPGSADPEHNITKAMSFKPDIVFLCYPSNDIVAGYTLAQYLANLRTMYDIVLAAGKKCYISTTQPRDAINFPQNQVILERGRDSIMMEFPGHSLNFFDPLVASSSLDINPIYSADGIHPNNAGHQLLFQVVQRANILMPIQPLALLVKDFAGQRTAQGIRLEWIAAHGSTEDFIVQRSGDGSFYQDIGDIRVIPRTLEQPYGFTDKAPLATRSFYRLKIAADENSFYSNVIVFDPVRTSFAIQRIYTGNGHTGITATISVPKDEMIYLAVFSTGGVRVKQQYYTCKAPATTLTVPLPPLAAGVYFLQIAAADGGRVVRPFAVSP